MPRFIRGGWLVPAHTTPAHFKDLKPAAAVKRNLHAKRPYELMRPERFGLSAILQIIYTVMDCAFFEQSEKPTLRAEAHSFAMQAFS
jgi:hypothetical protein